MINRKNKIIPLLFFMFEISSATYPIDHPTVILKLNSYVDSMIPAIAEFIQLSGLDPMVLPDLIEGFSYKLFLIHYHGELHLYNGLLHNIVTLKRSGDILVSYGEEIGVKAEFSVTDMMFKFDYSATLMNIGPTGGVEGYVSEAKILIDIALDFKTNKLILKDLYIFDVGDIDVKLTGHPLMDVLSNAIIRVIVTLFKRITMMVVVFKIRMIANEIVELINVSVGGLRAYIEQSELEFLTHI